MAIEPNVRKRKHNSQNDEGVEVIPKKIKKINKTPVKTKNSEDIPNTENPETHDSGFEEKPMKFSNDFKMLDFRTKLRGSNFITELRHFLYLSERNTRIVAKYIEKRGKPLEIAEALSRVDKANVLHISYICQALQAVVMEIVSNQPKHMESAVSACRYFIKVQSSVIGQLLESPQVKHRRIALKLLTAIVCVDPQMGRQILAAFNLLSDVRKIDQLLSHTKFELHEEETVRKCYIHFVLAFLVDGNTLLVQNILDRGILIQALISGLQYDDSTTVCLVLKTLKKYVLESANISKTKKIHVFELESCKQLVRLYDWFGPKVYAAKFSGKNASSAGNAGLHLPQETINTLVDLEERETVASAVHEFLLILFSSRKHGITFDVAAQLRQKHNTVQGKVIGFIHKPWLNERKTELILKTLGSCPDLARNTVRHFAGIVNPERTGENELPQAINFLGQVISTLHPNMLRNALTKLTLTDFSYWIKDICLPLETLVALQTGNMLLHSNSNCRLNTHRLLLVMFTQYSNFMEAAMQREQTKGGGSTLRRFKFDLFNHILTHFPSVDKILNSLYLTTSNSKILSHDVVLEHLNVTLDLILIICKQNRAFVNRTSTILDYLKLIRPLYAGEEEEAVEDDDGTKESTFLTNHGDIKLEIKAIKTILLLHPNALEPHQELFSNVLKSFIKGFIYGTDDVRRESGELLREIFRNTGIFDAGTLEIDLWLEALRFSDEVTVDVVTQVFIEVLKVTQAEVDLPETIETETNESNLNKLFENIEKGHSVQTYMQEFAMSKLLPLIFKGVEIVKPLDKYIELINFLLYHYHPTPAFVGKLYEMKFPNQPRYMSIWMENDIEIGKLQQLTLPKVTSRIPYLQKLQNSLFSSDSKVTFESIFSGENEEEIFEFEYEGKILILPKILENERLLLIYIQQLIFLIKQLSSINELKKLQAKQAGEYIVFFLAILNNNEENQKEDKTSYTDDGIAVKKESFLGSILSYIYDVRIGHISSAELLNTENSEFISFLNRITEFCSNLKDFSNYVKNFRLKIVKAVAISMETPELKKLQTNSEFLKMVEVFQLNSENCKEILDLLCNRLKYNDFFVTLENKDGFQKTFFYELLISVLQRLAVLGEAIECGQNVKTLSKFYTNFVHKLDSELNIEDYENVLHDFLFALHQYIPLIDLKLFECLFTERKVNKSSIKLGRLLLERCIKFDEKFISLLPENIGKRELVYPLLEIAFQKSIVLNSKLLTNIYQEYRNGFMKTIEKPQKAGVIYKEHSSCTVALVAACMPTTECLDFCKKRFQFNDASEVYQLHLIHGIYEKALIASEEFGKIFVNFLNLEIQMLSTDLKRQTLTKEKLELFAYQIYSWFNKVPKENEAIVTDFSSLIESQHWQNFCKSSLKTGMQGTEAPEFAEEQNSLLLKLMAFLCDKLYKDYQPKDTEEDTFEHPEPAQLFELICTHSKYYDIVLSPKASRIKNSLLCLLLTLAKKSPSLSLPHMEVPVILGAYQAKLTHADRYALALMQLYELHNPQGLQKYRPFIWGESAISFYALHVSDLDERSRLTQQETTITLVMSLIERHTCEYSIENFPIWRKLETIRQLPLLEFENPENFPLQHFGSNELERLIETNWSSNGNFKPSSSNLPASLDLRLCPEKDETFSQCYDPAFFVPLMSSCFAPGSYAHPARPVQNGLLALNFAALSSQDKEMRQAAGVVQLRYRLHFEQSKFYERPLWIQAYDNIQSGLTELSEAWKQKHKKHSKEYMPIPRVPYIPGLFIAKTFNITNDPTSVLYKQLTMYLRLKNTFNFQCVPEFNIFFHSPEVEHHTFRQFIIEVIRQGVKCSTDLFLLVSTNTFKVLLGFYGGAMSNLETNLLILSTLARCVKIPAAAKIMIDHVGILPWLESLISNLEFYHFDIIQNVISILNNLWYAITATSSSFYNYNFLALEIHHLILSLLSLVSARIEVSTFANLVNIMQKTANTAKQALPYAALTEVQLDKLIACAQKHFGAAHVQHLVNLKTLGGAGSEGHKEYCAQLYREDNADDVKVLALSSLRAYIIDWWQSR